VPAKAQHSEPNDEDWFASQIAETAKSLGYSVAEGPSPWVHLMIEHGGNSRVFVSFHRVAIADANVMAASAFVYFASSKRDQARTEPCCTEPFTFTADRDRAEVTAAFDAWLERSLTTGLELWRRSL
jgi:hypothetical protein